MMRANQHASLDDQEVMIALRHLKSMSAFPSGLSVAWDFMSARSSMLPAGCGPPKWADKFFAMCEEERAKVALLDAIEPWLWLPQLVIIGRLSLRPLICRRHFSNGLCNKPTGSAVP